MHARSNCPPAARTATASWQALGTGIVLRVTDPLWLPRASAILARELDAIDRACSRFRADSDLSRANAGAGGPPVPVAPLLIEALEIALRAAALTGGDVDPTVGAALVLAEMGADWGDTRGARIPKAANDVRAWREGLPGACPEGLEHYFHALTNRRECASLSLVSAFSATTSRPRPSRLRPRPRLPTFVAQRRSGYRTVTLDPARHTVRLPRGISLDLGATAKAWAADRGAHAIHAAARCGVLVSVGGDIATAGPAPAGGWRIHVTDNHRSSPDAPGQTVAIADGGLATSSVAVRCWRRGEQTLHHIIDPSSGAPARGPWRTVSVAAADCTDANIAATAALVRGERAPAWLQAQGLPARLLAHDGAVLRLGGWPAAESSARAPARAQGTSPGYPPAAVVGHGCPTPSGVAVGHAHVDDPQK